MRNLKHCLAAAGVFLLTWWAKLKEFLDWIGRGTAAKDIQEHGWPMFEKLLSWLLLTPSWVPGILATLLALALIYSLLFGANKNALKDGARSNEELASAMWDKPGPLRTLADLFRKDAYERIPLTDLYKSIFHSKRMQGAQDGELIKQMALILQAAADNKITFYGRLGKIQNAAAIAARPLERIPAQHFLDFEIEWMNLFEFNNTGLITGVHPDNSRGNTRTPLRDRRTETYSDLHVWRGDAQRWLKENGF